MKFDFGEVLTRAGQITWKHKVLWLYGILPSLAGFLVLPLVLGLFFFTDFDASGQPRFLEEPLFLIFFFIGVIVISLLSFVLSGISFASITSGVLRAEDGEEKLGVRSLFESGQKYWLRVLGVMLLTSIIVFVGFFAFFACLSLFGILTAGLGFLCIQPLTLLIYPLMLAVYGVIEEALAAAVADDLDVIASVQRGWELVKANFWSILLLSFIVYLAIGLLSAFVAIPFMLPFSFAPLFVDGSTPDIRSIMLMIGGVSLLMYPVMMLVQGIGVTFLKAAYAIAYLRLTRPKADVPIPSEANA